VERREQQLAPAHVCALVERHRGIAPDRGLEQRRVRLPGVEHLRVSLEDLLDQPRVGDVDDLADALEAGAEAVSVTGLAALEELDRPAHERRRLEHAGGPRAGR
jgi:hypothetical protein